MVRPPLTGAVHRHADDGGSSVGPCPVELQVGGLQVMLQYNIMPGARQPAGFGLVCRRAAPAQADTAADYRACPDKVRT